MISGLACLASLTLLIALASRLLTDHTLISQFAFWAPLWIYGITAVALCACWMLVRWFGNRRLLARLPLHELAQQPAPARDARWASPYVMLATGAILTAIGWAQSRTPDGRTPHAPTAPQQIRIVHWNLTSPDTHTWPGVITDVPECAIADILLLGVTMDDAQFQRVMRPLAGTHTIRRIHGLAVASRYEILRFRQVSLNLDPIVSARRVDGNSPEPWYQSIYNNHAESLGISRREFDLPDPGYIIEFTVAAPDGQRTFWFIDLPSNPFVSRMRIAEAVRTRVESEKLATPIAVIGDFNIPGGSASLRTIAPGFRSASGTAPDRASGPTWPRARPFLDIDHALIHPAATVGIYRTFDPGISDHWGQFLTLTTPSAAASESSAR